MSSEKSWKLENRDCLAALRDMPAASVETVVTDPPYGLKFLGKAWDAGLPDPAIWAECLRVAKPGAFLFAFGGTRTFHRLACHIEDAGWTLKDCVCWLYSGGFPKSIDLAKAIDKRRDAVDPKASTLAVTAFLREARDKAGKTNKEIDALFGFNGMAGHWTTQGSQPQVPTEPQWARLKEFLGFGPEMDGPAQEARETVEQVSDEWLQRPLLGNGGRKKSMHGGATGFSGKTARGGSAVKPAAKRWEGWGTALAPAWEPVVVAMKPADGTFASNALAHGVAGLNIEGARTESGGWPDNLAMDAETLAEFPALAGRAFCYPKARDNDKRGANNDHPTVKPLEVMRWLCRLSATPTGGTILDPFAGSGSTGVAALLEGRRFIGMELDEAHARTARERLEEAARRFRLLDRARKAALKRLEREAAKE